jgi:hypothetical protein
MLATYRPDISRGRWIYEWNVGRVWPDADLYALLLDRVSEKGKAAAASGNGFKPRELLRDERFRRAIGVNEHEGKLWFNKERFEHALDVLAMPRRAELRRAADKAEYRLDAFEKALAAPPKWASTRPARKTRAAPTSEKAAAKKPPPAAKPARAK